MYYEKGLTQKQFPNTGRKIHKNTFHPFNLSFKLIIFHFCLISTRQTQRNERFSVSLQCKYDCFIFIEHEWSSRVIRQILKTNIYAKALAFEYTNTGKLLDYTICCTKISLSRDSQRNFDYVNTVQDNHCF